MDPGDPFDIGQDIIAAKIQLKEQEKKANQKMAGFLLSAEDKE